MIVWLDQRIFGSGFGLKSPFFDDQYYWLVDTLGGTRDSRKGELYTFSAGFGAQLRSFQWTMPAPGERRKLCGYEMVVFNATRRGPRVEVSWAAVEMARLSHSEQLQFLSNMGADLSCPMVERNYFRDKQAAL